MHTLALFRIPIAVPVNISKQMNIKSHKGRSPEKISCSFGFCPNYLDPHSPKFGQLLPLFYCQCAKKIGQGSPPPSPSLNWPNMYSLWKVDKKIKSHSQGPRSGDIHFDDDEDWTLGSERGTDVIQVHTWQKWRVSYGDIKTLLAWCSWNGTVQNYLWHTMQSSGETSLFRWQFMRLATRWV